MKIKTALYCGIAAASLSATNAQALTINLVDLGGVTGSPAEQGFRAAARYWESVLTNNATVNLGVGYASLAPNVLAQAGSRKRDTSVAAWEAAVAATRSTSQLDQTAVLPTLNATGGISHITQGVDATGNNDTTVQVYEQGGTKASQVLFMNTSLQKALGLYVGTAGSLDATITFSTNFDFDFNTGNGINDDSFDFIGIAIHEIGHSLGFVSGVDYFDYFGGPDGPGAGALGYDLNNTSIFSALDMFRYSNDPNNVGPGGPALDQTVGTASYFSIDGGQTALFDGLFSTGSFNGDGRQASHFKDGPACTGQLGIMDPTFCRETEGEVTALDLAAFDAMGWNSTIDVLRRPGYTIDSSTILGQFTGQAVPEPATWAMMIGGFGLAGAAMRRSRKVAVSFA